MWRLQVKYFEFLEMVAFLLKYLQYYLTAWYFRSYQKYEVLFFFIIYIVENA